MFEKIRKNKSLYLYCVWLNKATVAGLVLLPSGLAASCATWGSRMEDDVLFFLSLMLLVAGCGLLWATRFAYPTFTAYKRLSLDAADGSLAENRDRHMARYGRHYCTRVVVNEFYALAAK